MAQVRPSRRSRAEVASRALAAIVGGYALATIATLLIAYAAPGSRAGALMAGMTASFAVYAAAIIWVFSARDAARAWIGLALAAAPLAAAALLLRSMGA